MKLVFVILIFATRIFSQEVFFPKSLENLNERQTNNEASKNSNDKKKLNPVTWGGNELTQEERIWNGFSFKTYILGGGAFIQSGNVRLMANSIEVLGDDALQGRLKGMVKVEDPSNGVFLLASNGFYDKNSDTVTLENNPTLTQNKKDGKAVRIKCDELVRHLEEGRTVFSGKVSVVSNDFQLFGENAIFFEKDDKIELSDKPFVFAKSKFLQSEYVAFYVNLGKIVLDKNALIYQVDYKKDIEKQKDRDEKKEIKGKKEGIENQEFQRQLTIFSGDQLIHSSKPETQTSMIGNANMIREEEEFQADQIQSSNNNNLVKATGKVIFLDKKNLIRMESDTAIHNEEEKYSKSFGQPVVYFLEKETLDEKGKLKAEVLERFGLKKEIVCRGNVIVDTQSNQAQGEYATFYEEEEKLVIEGNPRLKRDNTTVSAGKILVYPRDDKAYLTDGLKVLGEDKK